MNKKYILLTIFITVFLIICPPPLQSSMQKENIVKVDEFDSRREFVNALIELFQNENYSLVAVSIREYLQTPDGTPEIRAALTEILNNINRHQDRILNRVELKLQNLPLAEKDWKEALELLFTALDFDPDYPRARKLYQRFRQLVELGLQDSASLVRPAGGITGAAGISLRSVLARSIRLYNGPTAEVAIANAQTEFAKISGRSEFRNQPELQKLKNFYNFSERLQQQLKTARNDGDNSDDDNSSEPLLAALRILNYLLKRQPEIKELNQNYLATAAGESLNYQSRLEEQSQILFEQLTQRLKTEKKYSAALKSALCLTELFNRRPLNDQTELLQLILELIHLSGGNPALEYKFKNQQLQADSPPLENFQRFKLYLNYQFQSRPGVMLSFGLLSGLLLIYLTLGLKNSFSSDFIRQQQLTRALSALTKNRETEALIYLKKFNQLKLNSNPEPAELFTAALSQALIELNRGNNGKAIKLAREAEVVLKSPQPLLLYFQWLNLESNADSISPREPEREIIKKIVSFGNEGWKSGLTDPLITYIRRNGLDGKIDAAIKLTLEGQNENDNLNPDDN